MSRSGAMTGRTSSFLPPTAVCIWTCCLTTPVREDSLSQVLGRAHGEYAQVWLWPWSSAVAHVDEDAADTVLDPQWRELVGRWNEAEWREILAAGADEGETEALRRATHTGEPFGGAAFLTRLETAAGRRLKVLPRGRPKKEEAPQTNHRDIQRSLFASGG